MRSSGGGLRKKGFVLGMRRMICRPIDFLVSLGMEQPCHERRMESEGLRHSVGACGVAERVRSGRRKAALLTRSSLQPIGRVACWTWLLSGACTGLVLGQGAESGHTAERSSFIVKHWTSENDLPQNKVSCLKRTRDGYLWIGTYFGLVRFDGVHFATFSPMNASEMTNETINALAEDTEGKLWIGTEKGLFSYQAHQFRAVPAQNKLAGKPITGLTAARSGGIWIQTDDGVGKISTGVPAQFWEIDVKDQIRSIKESADGSLNVFMRKSWLVLTEKDGEWQTNWTAPGRKCTAWRRARRQNGELHGSARKTAFIFAATMFAGRSAKARKPMLSISCIAGALANCG